MTATVRTERHALWSLATPAMTAEIINLRRARKAKSRRDNELEAARNRARHGLSKAERTGRALDEARRQRELDGAFRTSPQDGDDDAPGEA